MLTPQPPVGHERCRVALEHELPAQPLVMLGPESTGKWLLAKYIGARWADWYNQFSCDTPGVDSIREMRRFLSTPAMPSADHPSAFKVVLINLDGAKSAGVQHAMLKELEEPPEYSRFLLTASRFPLLTVSSRCLVWRLGSLTEQEVALVLEREGYSARDAAAIAPIGRGQVAPALIAAQKFRPARQSVIYVFKAIAARDRDMLESVVGGWGETEDWMMREFLGSAATGRPSTVFTQAERMTIKASEARRGMAILASSGQSRPKIAVCVMASALMEAR